MVELALKSSFADEQVVDISTRLDNLLNQYQGANQLSKEIKKG